MHIRTCVTGYVSLPFSRVFNNTFTISHAKQLKKASFTKYNIHLDRFSILMAAKRKDLIIKEKLQVIETLKQKRTLQEIAKEFANFQTRV